MAEERRAQALTEFAEDDTDWEKNLEYEPRSTVLKNSLGNLLLILKNDPKLQGIRYNRLANQIFGDNALPWERPYQSWRDADMAQLVAYVDKTYLVIGDDNAEGDTISEVYRKAVSVVTHSGNMIRFRTVLLAGEGNGQHQKTCIFTDASDAPGSGAMFNLLKVPWGKGSQMILTVECRLTLQ